MRDINRCNLFRIEKIKLYVSCRTSFSQIAVTITRKNGFWREVSTSTAMQQTSTSGVVGQYKKNRNCYFKSDWSMYAFIHRWLKCVANATNSAEKIVFSNWKIALSNIVIRFHVFVVSTEIDKLLKLPIYDQHPQLLYSHRLGKKWINTFLKSIDTKWMSTVPTGVVNWEFCFISTKTLCSSNNGKLKNGLEFSFLCKKVWAFRAILLHSEFDFHWFLVSIFPVLISRKSENKSCQTSSVKEIDWSDLICQEMLLIDLFLFFLIFQFAAKLLQVFFFIAQTDDL